MMVRKFGRVDREGGVMTDDWPQIRARLKEMTGSGGLPYVGHRADIRAALQRIEDRETTECAEILRLRQRVKELEQGALDRMFDRAAETVPWAKRAEAAEAKLAQVVEVLHILQKHDPPLNHEIMAFLDGALAAANGE